MEALTFATDLINNQSSRKLDGRKLDGGFFGNGWFIHMKSCDNFSKRRLRVYEFSTMSLQEVYDDENKKFKFPQAVDDTIVDLTSDSSENHKRFVFKKTLGQGNFGLIFAVKRIQKKGVKKCHNPTLALKVQICNLKGDYNQVASIIKVSQKLKKKREMQSLLVNKEIQEKKGRIKLRELRKMLNGYDFHKFNFRSVYEEVKLNSMIKKFVFQEKKECYRNLLLNQEAWIEVSEYDDIINEKGEVEHVATEIAVFILMEKVFCNLNQYLMNINNGKEYYKIMPDHERWSFLQYIINALDVLHSNGVAHLDLHEENVFIVYSKKKRKVIDKDTGKEEIKNIIFPICTIGDFGRSVDQQNASNNPEKYVQHSNIDGIDDQYLNILKCPVFSMSKIHKDLFFFIRLCIFLFEKTDMKQTEKAMNAGSWEHLLDVLPSFISDEKIDIWNQEQKKNKKNFKKNVGTS